MGFRSKRPLRVPMSTQRHRRLQSQRARDHRDRTMDQWKRVVWSLHHVDGCVRIRRLPLEMLLETVLAPNFMELRHL